LLSKESSEEADKAAKKFAIEKRKRRSKKISG